MIALSAGIALLAPALLATPALADAPPAPSATLVSPAPGATNIRPDAPLQFQVAGQSRSLTAVLSAPDNVVVAFDPAHLAHSVIEHSHAPFAAAVQSALGAPASLSVKVQDAVGMVSETATVKDGQGYQSLAHAIDGALWSALRQQKVKDPSKALPVTITASDSSGMATIELGGLSATGEGVSMAHPVLGRYTAYTGALYGRSDGDDGHGAALAKGSFETGSAVGEPVTWTVTPSSTSAYTTAPITLAVTARDSYGDPATSGSARVSSTSPSVTANPDLATISNGAASIAVRDTQPQTAQTAVAMSGPYTQDTKTVDVTLTYKLNDPLLFPGTYSEPVPVSGWAYIGDVAAGSGICVTDSSLVYYRATGAALAHPGCVVEAVASPLYVESANGAVSTATVTITTPTGASPQISFANPSQILAPNQSNFVQLRIIEGGVALIGTMVNATTSNGTASGMMAGPYGAGLMATPATAGTDTISATVDGASATNSFTVS